MTSRSQYDALILGGGPAGLATALSLKQHQPDASIGIVEPNPYNSLRPGETLSPSCRSIFETLKLWEAFVTEPRFRSAPGISSAWGDEILVDQTLIKTGWHITRPAFDAWLADIARSRGISWITGDCRDADFIVDATGRKAAFAHEMGANRQTADQLVGHYRFYNEAPSNTSTVIEAYEHGWWYAASLPDGRLAVACFCDAEMARSVDKNWDQYLSRAPNIQHMAVGESSAGFIRSAASGCLDKMTGSNWLATGDAACTFDPITGQGISKAMQSGIFASYAILDYWRHKPEGLAKYEAILKQSYEEYLQLRRTYYSLEERWRDQPFWQKRNKAA